MNKKDGKKSERKITLRRPDEGIIRALKREQQRLTVELKKQQVLSQDHPTTGNHMADDATDVAEQAKTLALRTHLEGMLKEIDRAVARIDKGTYGLCERCGEPIGESD
jgi:RNA polymerase-binding transcription factor DksA